MGAEACDKCPCKSQERETRDRDGKRRDHVEATSRGCRGKAGSPQPLKEQEGLSPGATGGNQPCPHLDLGLPASRTKSE